MSQRADVWSTLGLWVLLVLGTAGCVGEAPSEAPARQVTSSADVLPFDPRTYVASRTPEPLVIGGVAANGVDGGFRRHRRSVRARAALPHPRQDAVG